MKKNPRL